MRQIFLMTAVLFFIFCWGTATGQIVTPTLTLNVPASAPDTVKAMLQGTTLRYVNRKLTPQEWREKAERLQAIINAFGKQGCPACDSTGIRQRDETIARLRDSLKIFIERAQEKPLPIATMAPDTCVPKKVSLFSGNQAVFAGIGWLKHRNRTWLANVTTFGLGYKRLVQTEGVHRFSWWGEGEANIRLTTSSVEKNGIKNMNPDIFLQSFDIEGGITFPFKIFDDGVSKVVGVAQGGSSFIWNPVLEKAAVGPLIGGAVVITWGTDGCSNATHHRRLTASLKGAPFGITGHLETLSFEMGYVTGRLGVGFFTTKIRFNKFYSGISSHPTAPESKSFEHGGIRFTYGIQ